jgi:hypothetical protein
LVAGDDVFDGVGGKVAEVGESRGEGGAVIENVVLPAFPPGYGLFKRVMLFPKGKYFLFHFGKVNLWVYRFIHTPLLWKI